MEFGKLCSWEKQGNRVVFQFEKRTGRVEILTPEIFNVFSGAVMAVQMNFERDKLFDELGLMRLRESYMRSSEKSPQERFAFVAETFGSNPEHAQRIYDYASRHWLSFSTPILSFGRSKKGLPISCFLTYMEDSAEGLVDTLSEVNWLSMLGGGVGIHVRIRSADEKSVGVMPHLKVYDAACLAYRQGSTRRGSYAAFLDIDHPDIIPFIEMRKPTGDQNMKALNLHHGVNLSDAFMEKIEASMRDSSYDDTWELRHPSTHEVVAKVSARDLWQRILEMRMHTGEPYLVFIDTANRALPSWLKDKGLSIHGSNLCTEIFLPTSHDRTAVCCLSSLNLEYFDEWKNNQQFITDANHELKTPLTLILSNLDIVEAELGQNEWLDDIRSEGERMGLMINQLVALSRMDESQAHMVRSAFDLSAAVEDTVSEFQPLAAERGKKLQTSIEPGIRYEGDEGLIRRLASILMDNAVKYCDEGGEIRVEVCQHRHPVLIVENTYAQVDQLELDRLFDRFYRADKARTFSGSFGVGLSIAQSIVRSHRGSIHAYRKGNIIGFRAELK